MTKPAKNTSDSAQVIDDEGHILPGGEWGDVDPDSDRVRALVEAGVLVVTDSGPESAPSAAAGEPADETPAPSTGSKAAHAAKKETT